MTGLSFVPVEMTVEFRGTPQVERIVRTGGWQGVEVAPKVAIPAPPEDPAALYEEPERWDGLS